MLSLVSGEAAMLSWDLAIGCAVTAALFSFVTWRMRLERSAHETWVSTAARATGVVSRIRISDSADSLTEYTPVIVYRAADGHLYSIDGESSTSDDVPVGAEIEVAYDPALPSSGRVATPGKWTEYDRRMRIVTFVVIALIIAFAVSLVRQAVAG